MTEPLSKKRIESIDLLRGLVMIIMVLDHVRDFFHADAYLFDPTDVTQTNPMLFFTRFVTHFCAPVFVFLAGTSAYFVGQRMPKTDLTKWLLKRGIWLIFVELVIMKFGWAFKLDYTVIVLQVIWALGASMIFLGAFIHVPKRLMIGISLTAIFGHNFFDSFQPDYFNSLWVFTHVMAPIQTPFNTIFSAYPLVPWIFVMAIGFHFGALYVSNYSQEKRKSALRIIGFACIGLFILIRAINVFGEPKPWTPQDSPIYTFMSFFELTKYPPSLLYLLITLGPSFILLSYSENWKGKWHSMLITIGRVPMFYYIIHVYLIHTLALIAAVATGFPASSMIIDVFVTLSPELQGYGFSLWVVYGTWIAIVLALYPLSKWFDGYKSMNRDKWWLTYL